MPLYTLLNHWERVYATNATDSSFPSRVPTTTAPAVANPPTGVFEPSPGESGLHRAGPGLLKLMFYGTGADNSTFNARVIGWAKVAVSGSTTLWVPTVLAEYVATLSAAVGVAGAALVATERFADTLSRTTGIENVSDQVLSPGADLPAHALVDAKGFTRVEVTFDLVTATAANALYSWVG